MIRRFLAAAALAVLAGAAPAQAQPVSSRPLAAVVSPNDTVLCNQGLISPITRQCPVSGLLATMTAAQVDAALGFSPISGAQASALFDPLGAASNATNLTSGVLPAGRLPGFSSGDVTSAPGSTVLTLRTVQSSPGSYGSATSIPVLTVDAQGRITSISSAAATGGGGTGGAPATTDASQLITGTLNASRLPGASGDVTSASGTNVFALPTVASSPGTFPKVTFNGKGLVTAGSALAPSDVTAGLGYTPLNRAGDAVTGALTVGGAFTTTTLSATQANVSGALNGGFHARRVPGHGDPADAASVRQQRQCGAPPLTSWASRRARAWSPSPTPPTARTRQPPATRRARSRRA